MTERELLLRIKRQVEPIQQQTASDTEKSRRAVMEMTDSRKEFLEVETRLAKAIQQTTVELNRQLDVIKQIGQQRGFGGQILIGQSSPSTNPNAIPTQTQVIRVVNEGGGGGNSHLWGLAGEGLILGAGKVAGGALANRGGAAVGGVLTRAGGALMAGGAAAGGALSGLASATAAALPVILPMAAAGAVTAVAAVAANKGIQKLTGSGIGDHIGGALGRLGTPDIFETDPEEFSEYTRGRGRRFATAIGKGDTRGILTEAVGAWLGSDSGKGTTGRFANIKKNIASAIFDFALPVIEDLRPGSREAMGIPGRGDVGGLIDRFAGQGAWQSGLKMLMGAGGMRFDREGMLPEPNPELRRRLMFEEAGARGKRLELFKATHAEEFSELEGEKARRLASTEQFAFMRPTELSSLASIARREQEGKRLSREEEERLMSSPQTAAWLTERRVESLKGNADADFLNSLRTTRAMDAESKLRVDGKILVDFKVEDMLDAFKDANKKIVEIVTAELDKRAAEAADKARGKIGELDRGML